jgi:hypothetical protein
MTNEERQQAIEWLKRRPVMMAGAKSMYDLAVEALEAYVPDMNDGNMISRQAAIDTLNELHDEPSAWLDLAVDALEKLPSAQPKRGKWILDRSGAYCCSECMEPCASYVMMQPRDKFCKMCGSRNEVTE